jgi:hypothetical protein
MECQTVAGWPNVLIHKGFRRAFVLIGWFKKPDNVDEIVQRVYVLGQLCGAVALEREKGLRRNLTGRQGAWSEEPKPEPPAAGAADLYRVAFEGTSRRRRGADAGVRGSTSRSATRRQQRCGEEGDLVLRASYSLVPVGPALCEAPRPQGGASRIRINRNSLRSLTPPTGRGAARALPVKTKSVPTVLTIKNRSTAHILC